MVLLRNIGWKISRAYLYSASTLAVVFFSIVWGGGIAYILRWLIFYYHPNIIFTVFSFGALSYSSIPNFGLVDHNTIPAEGWPRHALLYILPLAIFIASSIIFAFILK